MQRRGGTSFGKEVSPDPFQKISYSSFGRVEERFSGKNGEGSSALERVGEELDQVPGALAGAVGDLLAA
jgi:hypothetical protein